MNDRIKQLAEQAQQYAEYITPQGLEWLPAFKERFAELIVRECADVACKHMELNEGTDYNLGGKIKKHFGVEE